MKSYLTALAILLTLALLVVGTGCTTNAATGRLQFDSMSTSEEIALGTEAMPELTKEYGGVVNDQVLRDYVTNVGLKLTKFTEADNPDLPWEFTLLDTEVINAFALPGGKVFMTRGLMTRMNNEAQLAGVLGHEIAHVTAQHIDDRIGQSMVLAGVVLAAGVATKDSDDDMAQVLPLIVGAGGQGYLLKFGRSQESESDKLGMRYMRRAGYDPAAQLQVMQILEESRKEAGGGSPPEWLSTHPYPTTRIKQIKQLLANDFRHSQNNPDYKFYRERFQTTARTRLDALLTEKTTSTD